MGKRYDAEEVSAFMADLCSALNGYEAGANSLEAAYNKYVHNSTFKGVMADTAKRCIDHGQRNLHKENLVIQNKLLARYKDMKDLFEYMVDSSPKSRIDTDVLEDVKKDFQGYRKVVSTHGENIEDIAKYLQDNFSEDCDVDFTQPSYQEARDAYSKFSGPKGFIDKTIEKFEEFDEEACAALTRSGIQAYIYDYQQELRQIGNNLLGMNPETPKVDETILKSIKQGKAIIGPNNNGTSEEKIALWLSTDYKMTPEDVKEAKAIASAELAKVQFEKGTHKPILNTDEDKEHYKKYVDLMNKCSPIAAFGEGFGGLLSKLGIVISYGVEDIVVGGVGEMGATMIDNSFGTNTWQDVHELREEFRAGINNLDNNLSAAKANAKIQNPDAYMVGDITFKAIMYYLTNGIFAKFSEGLNVSKFAAVQIGENLQDLMLDTTGVYNDLIEDGELSKSDCAVLGQNVLQNAMYNIAFWEFGEVIDLVLPKKVSSSVDLNKIANGAEDAGDSAKGVSNDIKFSDMSESEIAKIVEEYKHKSPIEIPDNVNYKAKSMSDGYEQISYKWNDGTYKYEARWHTRTSGAPEGQGNTWVIQRTVPGNGGTKPSSQFLIGENEWIEGWKWYDAINARKNGTATMEQIEILDKGHWKEK